MDQNTYNAQIIGQRIKESRINANMTQKELAKRLGLKSYQIIGQYEIGVRKPKRERINQLAQILDVNPAYLAGESDRPKGIVVVRRDGSKNYIDVPSFLHNINSLSLEKENKGTADALMEQIKQEILLNAQQEKINFYENEILEIMKSLNNEGQEKVIDYANDLAENPKYHKDTSNED